MKRRKIPKFIKDHIFFKQSGRCCCCLNRGKEYHHIVPVALGGDNAIENIVLLCDNHHKLLHLGDLETCKTILEYKYYNKYGKLPNDISEIEEMVCKINEQYKK